MSVRLTIDSRGTTFVTQARERAPEARKHQENGTANYEPDEVINCNWCYSTLCPISELHDPVDLQRQLECISPPVGKPTGGLHVW